MNIKLSILTFALMGGLVLQSSAIAADAEAYEVLVKQTQSALDDAAKKVQLWSTSEILLDKAATAAASGDYDLAVKLVTEAGLQVDLALATAAREKKAWQKGVPR